VGQPAAFGPGWQVLGHRSSVSVAVEPPQLDIGPRGQLIIGLRDDRQAIGKRQCRQYVTPLAPCSTGESDADPAALIADR
jgi:hypothetical protein